MHTSSFERSRYIFSEAYYLKKEFKSIFHLSFLFSKKYHFDSSHLVRVPFLTGKAEYYSVNSEYHKNQNLPLYYAWDNQIKFLCCFVAVCNIENKVNSCFIAKDTTSSQNCTRFIFLNYLTLSLKPTLSGWVQN